MPRPNNLTTVLRFWFDSWSSRRLFSRQFDCSILSFVGCNFPLVFEFGKACRSLFVHLLLQVLSLNSVFLVHLLQDVQLVRLASQCLLRCSRLVLCILLRNCCLHLLPLVVLEPVGLALHLLLEEDVFLARLVHVLKQVNPSLVLTLPLCIAHLVLSISFLLNFFIN